jgi:hypothetical protein
MPKKADIECPNPTLLRVGSRKVFAFVQVGVYAYCKQRWMDYAPAMGIKEQILQFLIPIKYQFDVQLFCIMTVNFGTIDLRRAKCTI